MIEKEKLRIDKYLWAIRIFKTRSLAAEGCNSGKVKFNGANVKPAKTVAIGDQYEIKTEEKKWKIEVTSLLHNRVKYEEAIKHYLDLSPEEVVDKTQRSAFVFNTGKRKSKQGRPTKKEKRKLDDWLGFSKGE
ncbi:MAG TPA: RNA-binding S4 domain-containing protein [Hanamia sp.]|nr:RNA-binding S4 domain-containing protein [Hanamia sp.]